MQYGVTFYFSPSLPYLTLQKYLADGPLLPSQLDKLEAI